MSEMGGLVQAAASLVLQAGKNAAGDVIATAISHTKWLDSTGMRRTLAASDFSLQDLNNGATTIYLVLPPQYLDIHGRFSGCSSMASIERYMAALETADRQDGELAPANSVRLKDKIAALKAQMQGFKAMEAEVHAAPDQQISLTDPDARAMGTSGKGTAIVGYNVQTAVDAQHHLIVAHDVTNVGHDRDQLSNMAGQAKAAMGVEALDVLADRGYFKGEEVLACEPLGVTPYVPKPLTSGSKAAGRFGKQDFVYIPEEDAYRCPADQRLTWRFTSAEKGMTLHSYWTSKCAECPLKTQCTTGKERRIKRWEHEAVIDAMQDRLDRAPKSMRVRRATVEHPFGTLKAWMGATHFKTRTLEKVRTEMSLHVLAYNLKRVIAILGAQPLMEAMRA